MARKIKRPCRECWRKEAVPGSDYCRHWSCWSDRMRRAWIAANFICPRCGPPEPKGPRYVGGAFSGADNRLTAKCSKCGLWWERLYAPTMASEPVARLRDSYPLPGPFVRQPEMRVA